jgi:serine/threonine protein phosphatase PrpC
MAGLIAQAPPENLAIARTLVEAALASGGKDNITVTVISMDPSRTANEIQE